MPDVEDSKLQTLKELQAQCVREKAWKRARMLKYVIDNWDKPDMYMGENIDEEEGDIDLTGYGVKD